MGGQELGRVCTYSEACKPFENRAVPMGNVCIVQDMAGTAKCVVEGPNKGEGQPCGFANDCADGLYCLGTGDGGSVCTWVEALRTYRPVPAPDPATRPHRTAPVLPPRPTPPP